MLILRLFCLFFIACMTTDRIYAELSVSNDFFTCCENDVSENPCDEVAPVCFNGHIFSIGPELYHINRTRQGGTRQHGNAIGVRATYDHIKRYRLYWGGQAFYGSGILRGHTGSKDDIHSRLTDEQIEGSLGYTLGTKNFPYFLFTPFAGYGYFKERNKFNPPSPLSVTFSTDFQYIPFGFLSSAMVNSWLRVGLNARFRWLWDAHCKVTHDPEFGRLKLLVEDRIHYRIELPFVYCRPLFCQLLEVAIVPFYERRTYGGRENYPFDFFETKLRIYGINFQLIYQF